MFIDNEFMSDEAFVEWLAQRKDVLQHTGLKTNISSIWTVNCI
jgi:hypothetical protein